MKGQVTVTKVYKDGSKETIMKDSCNVLTDGFGMNIASMLNAYPDAQADRFHFKYFQVGVSSYYQNLDFVSVGNDNTEWAYSLPLATHNNFYELSSALTSVDQYGTDGDLEVVEREILTVSNPFKPQEKLNYTKKSVLLAKLYDHPTTNITDQSVNTKITIDRESLNGIAIREFGLFSENPEGTFLPTAVLAAYKSLPEPIVKNDEFSLDIEWVIKLNQSPTRTQEYYDVWELKHIGDVIRFHPGVKPLANHYYVKTLLPGDRYTLQIECPSPTPRSGYLHYSLSGDAVSGLHYSIGSDYASPLYVPKGTTLIDIPIEGLNMTSFTNPQTVLEFVLDDFTGGFRIPEIMQDGTPDSFLIFFRNENAAPVAEVSWVPAAGSVKDLVQVDLDVSCASDVTMLMHLEGDGGFVVRNPAPPTGNGAVLFNTQVASSVNLPMTITAGSTTNHFQIQANSLGGTPATTVDASSYNVSSGATEYNNFAHSNDFSPEWQPPVQVSIQDIVERTDDLITPQSYWWRNNIGHSKIYYPGYPTLKTHSGNDTYSTGPTQHMYLHSYVVPDVKAPDGVQAATLSYAPSSVYIWPEIKQLNAGYYANTGLAKPVDSPPKIRRSYTTYEYDQLNRSIERSSQLQEYNSSMSSIVFSMYVKKFDDTITAVHPNITESSEVAMNEYVELRLYSRGFKETGNLVTPGSAGKGCLARFKWNSTTGGLDFQEVLSDGAWDDSSYLSGGVFSGTSDDIPKMGYQDEWCGDGWYRCFIVAAVPEALTEAATNAELNWDGSGSVSQYFIFPTTSSTPGLTAQGLPGYTGELDSAPTTLSGTLHCWAQYEETLKSETHDRKVPREYQPRPYDYWTPIGNAFVDPSNQKVTVTL